MSPPLPKTIPCTPLVHPQSGCDGPYAFGEVITATLQGAPTPIAEQCLLDIIVDLIEDRTFNPHRGSLSAEKVHNAVQEQQPRLTRLVLGKHSFSTFIGRHPQLFCLFNTEGSKQRLRYLPHTQWAAGDAAAWMERQAQHSHLTKALVSFLHASPDGQCTVDAFLTAYGHALLRVQETGVGCSWPIPKRGDFVRLVRSRSNRFHFNNEAHTIAIIRRQKGSNSAPCKPSSVPAPLPVSQS